MFQAKPLTYEPSDTEEKSNLSINESSNQYIQMMSQKN